MRGLASIGIGVAVLTAASSSVAQTPAAQTIAEQRQSRYQVGVMERVLEVAVEHGATLWRDRMQAQIPAEMLITDNARARGFRLEGYGVFFDVIVPSVESAPLWSLQTLDQNDLGLESALKTLQAHIKGNPDLEQALKRVELQVNPTVVARAAAPVTAGARTATGSAAAAPDEPPRSPQQPADPILSDPVGAYRTEVVRALIDAMLDHSASLGIAPTEWLTVAAKRNDDRPQLAPADSDARTFMIRLRGSDLVAFLARQITKDEALERIEVRVF